jgi:hypothetical protein
MKPLLPVCILASAQAGLAQSSISTTDRYMYSANAGWIDGRPDAASGLVLTETFLSGKAYTANFGWIDFGDGSPDNGHSYSNASATDYGVNVSPSGTLAGYAYAANIGWIQFEQVHGKPAGNLLSGQFQGHAYSGNIGWIALDTASSNLAATAMTCPDSVAMASATLTSGFTSPRWPSSRPPATLTKTAGPMRRNTWTAQIPGIHRTFLMSSRKSTMPHLPA